MGRRQKSDGLIVELMHHVAAADWKVGVWLAVGSFLCLQWIASWQFGPLSSPQQIASAVMPQMAAGLASVFRFVIPPLFLLAALVSYTRTRRPSSNQPTPRQLTVVSKRGGRSKPDDAWNDQLGSAGNGGEVQPVEVRPTSWTMDVLKRMEWKRFEYLAAAYYERIGFRTEPIGWGADGGVDVILYRGGLSEPVSVVQCKAWNGRQVPVEEVRALLGVMTDRKVRTGVFLTTSTFTQAAAEFADGNRIALVDGADFLKRLLALPADKQAELLSVASEGDWTTPSCPSCGVKLVLREGNWGRFWGCGSFPRCRYRRNIKRA